MTKETGNPSAKLAYKSPSLVHYGSVRNLTGGSVGPRRDGMGTMSGRMRMGNMMGMMGMMGMGRGMGRGM